MNIVILAGGGGTRLWPVSRVAKPKQFQNIIGQRSLLELTRLRLGEDFSAANIYYSVTAQLQPVLREALPYVAADHFFVEPEKRDTGPAMGFVAAILALTAPDEPVAFVPSDHYIANHERFRASLHVAESLIRETDSLLDIGVTPTWPNTNLGYTHIGRRCDERDGIEIFSFRGHTEKPPLEQAMEFLDSGEYLWHANYYMWTPRKFLEAYEEYAPATHATLRRIQDLWKRGNRDRIAEEYAKLEKVSIDYAITEKLDPSRVLIIKAPFDWSDVGTWGLIKKLRQENAEANVVEGAEHVSIDTADCMIYGPSKKVIATVGVSNLVIVDTEDALLVCDKDRDQDIKRIVEELQEQQQDQHL